MRITNSIILRGYNRDLNRLMTQKTACERRITSTRKFSRASENPLSAAKSLNVRRSLYNLTQYQENLKTANKFYTEAETSLLQVSDKMAMVREELVAACNTTKDKEEYAIYGEHLETIAKELVSIFNTDSAGRAIFGGESDNATPFTMLEDSTGHLSTVCYHGVPVNAMDNYRSYPYSNPVTVDIGLGMTMDQKTQAVDPQSVLDISFNGAKITGCGAESGTADIDLGSIKPDRKYCLDVYVGGYKKTIEFTGQKAGEVDDPDNPGQKLNQNAANVKAINDILKEAFRKEVAYDQIKQPTIDAQGVIYSEGSIVSAVNNENHKTAKKLTVDNDSGFTNKFKLNFALLNPDTDYSIDVTRGDITKTIQFRTVAHNADPDEEANQNVAVIQKQLDIAFGKDEDGNSLVSISNNPVTKGCFSAEGAIVTVADTMKMTGSNVNTVQVESTHYDQIDLANLNAGKKYMVNVNGTDITFEGGQTVADTFNSFKAACTAAGVAGTLCQPQGDKKSVGFSDANPPIAITKPKNLSADATAITPSKGATYTVDLNNMTEGKKYSLKVVYDNKVKVISFTGSADPNACASNIQGALASAFGVNGIHNKITIDGDGVVTTYDGNPVAVTSVEQGTSKDPALIERNKIFSNNYIQLTIDAAKALREGDIDYANGCIDRIVEANEHLLVQIADLGSNEDFIDFNIEKLTTRELNLSERQNDLEVTDAEKEITLWKTYEALYNACLQMSSSVIPNSIFNYMR